MSTKTPTLFRPMLSGTVENLADLNLPVMASPKLDGIRCIIINGKAVTRNLKLVPNFYIFDKLRSLPAFDGELIVGPDTDPDVWNKSSSGVMRATGEPDFTFRVFDMLPLGSRDEPFAKRHKRAYELILKDNRYRKLEWLRLVNHTTLKTRKDIAHYEQTMVDLGYEGIMLRDPEGIYKYGRSTPREQGLMKFKRFHDAEARVVGIREQMHNANEAKTNTLGLTERTSHKANLKGKGTLGALIVRATLGNNSSLTNLFTSKGEVEFQIGTGFDDTKRAQIWRDKNIIGKIVKFKYQKLSPEGVPIFPVFLGFRKD